MSKTVVILGTGATQGSGFSKCGKSLPGDRGFFGHDAVVGSLKKYPALEIMLDFFKTVRNHTLDDISLEEAWTFIELCSKETYSNLYDLEEEKRCWLNLIRRQNSKREDEHYRTTYFRDIKTIPDDLASIDMTLLAGWDLRCLLDEVYREVKHPSQSENNYMKLIKRHKLDADDTTFISLNYDTILESAIKDFLWFYPHIQTNISRDVPGFQVLKPHGSLNWLFEGNLQPVKITTDYSLEPVRNRSKSSDNDFEEACIIPPTQLKQTLNLTETQTPHMKELFKKIWESLKDALIEAERVFIIGYSFPSTDHHFRTLLRIVNRKKEIENKSYSKVYCCTKDDGFDGTDNLFPCSNGLIHISEGFERFVNQAITA